PSVQRPVPTSVAGFDDQLPSSWLTTVGSTTWAADAGDSSVVKTPHGEVSLMTSVWSSGALMPLNIFWLWAQSFVFETTSYPTTWSKLPPYASCPSAADRLKE